MKIEIIFLASSCTGALFWPFLFSYSHMKMGTSFSEGVHFRSNESCGRIGDVVL